MFDGLLIAPTVSRTMDTKNKTVMGRGNALVFNMQVATNTQAVGAFNAAAPALESIVVKGVTYEVFHDYYHTHRQNPDWKSVGYRIAGQPDSFNFHSRAFMRSCKTQRTLQTWMDDMMEKHGGWEVR